MKSIKVIYSVYLNKNSSLFIININFTTSISYYLYFSKEVDFSTLLFISIAISFIICFLFFLE